METTCMKCGSSDRLPDLAVVSSMDNVASVPVSILAFNNPDAWVFKGSVSQKLVARVCGACGFAELYVENPGVFRAAIKKGVADQ